MTLGFVICARNANVVAVESFFSIFSLSAFVATLVHLKAIDDAAGETNCVREDGALGKLVVTVVVALHVVGVVTFTGANGEDP